MTKITLPLHSGQFDYQVNQENLSLKCSEANGLVKGRGLLARTTYTENSHVKINGKEVHAFKILTPALHEKLQIVSYLKTINGATLSIPTRRTSKHRSGFKQQPIENFSVQSMINKPYVNIQLEAKRYTDNAEIIDQMIEGARFNDVPDGIVESLSGLLTEENSFTTFIISPIFYLSSKLNKTSDTYKSHFGEYQWWHSMIPKEGMTNLEVKNEIIYGGLIEWYRNAIKAFLKPEGFFNLARIGHTIADSYSGGHTTRDDSTFEIKYFHDYSEHSQHDHHSGHDQPQNTQGLSLALNALVEMNELYKSKASEEEFKDFLDKVLTIAPENLNVSGSKIKIKEFSH